jgi:hypothetical protein
MSQINSYAESNKIILYRGLRCPDFVFPSERRDAKQRAPGIFLGA